MSSYHAKVAKVMADSIIVGTHNSYEECLSALLRNYPTEADLRAHVAKIEAELQAEDPVLFAGCRFLPEDNN